MYQRCHSSLDSRGVCRYLKAITSDFISDAASSGNVMCFSFRSNVTGFINNNHYVVVNVRTPLR